MNEGHRGRDPAEGRRPNGTVGRGGGGVFFGGVNPFFGGSTPSTSANTRHKGR